MVEAKVVFRDPSGRATRVQFSSDAPPTLGEYTLDYRYNVNDFAVTWTSDAASAMFMRGEARFVPISATTSLMTYRLEKALALPLGALERSMQEEAADVVEQFCAHMTRV